MKALPIQLKPDKGELVEELRPVGSVELIVRDTNLAIIKVIQFKNTVLKTGRQALASSLANNVSDTYQFFISRMLFGDGGTVSGVRKSVSPDRNGLFGLTRANKTVIATIDPIQPYKVVFTSVLDFDDANGYSLNEMALQMNNDDLYSMSTFEDFSKTSSIQITFNWSISFI